MKKISAVLIGAGQRGADAYALYALSFPLELEFVAVAEPRKDRREEFAKLHNIASENVFESYDELLAQKKLADCAFICTQDRDHFNPVMRALELGYHVLCEKPMSTDLTEMREMEKQARKYDRVLSICHVLRYSPFFTQIKKIIDSGQIGKIVSFQHREGVGYYHAAHSFVRGNWNNSDVSCPMILAKCCHDIDILSFLIGSKCKRVSSFGALNYFKAENAPKDAPLRCLDGCPERDTCPYYAPRFYLEHPRAKIDNFIHVVSSDLSPKGIMEALKTGPYGRCVFHCDNNVVDHQIVNLEYDNGVTASLMMTAFSLNCERELTIGGTLGEIKANMDESIIKIADFTTGNTTQINVVAPENGHGGSDNSMIKAFVKLVGVDGKGENKTDISVSVESHVVALYAEKSRLAHEAVIDID